MLDQERDVPPTLAEWRDVNADHIEAIVEVPSKTALDDGRFQILVRRSDDLHIHFDCLVAP